MASSVKISNIVPSRKVFQDLQKFMRSDVPMNGIIKDIKKEILRKTDRGLDYRGKKFQPLTRPYAKRKAMLGRGSKANLKSTGHMLKSMRAWLRWFSHGVVEIDARPYPVDPKTKQSSRASTKVIANIHGQGTGRQPQREFMNITKNFKKKLLQKHYDKPILKILGRG